MAETGSLLRRYQAGEHAAVWADMMALGDKVRGDPYADDAWAVARETMRRARHNVDLIIQRLDAKGYQFWNGEQGTLGPAGMKMSIGGGIVSFASPMAAAQAILNRDVSNVSPGMRQHTDPIRGMLASLMGTAQALQTAKTERLDARVKQQATITDHRKDANVFSPPDKEDIALVRNLETRGLVFPLSWRAWIEEVGEVNLAGSHPTLCFWEGANFPGVYADPLMVTLDHFRFEVEAWVEEDDAGEDAGALSPVISWDPQVKARLAVEDEQLDEGYTLDLPNAAADGMLLGERRKTGFVDYLRNAFRWGGFPGWELQATRPEKELALLTDSLLPL